MKPERIVLVRHGQSLGNADKNTYKTTPDYAITLTAKGNLQAHTVGQELNELVGKGPVQFYVSPFWRTLQTFIGIAEWLPKDFVKFYADSRLREQEWGQDLAAKTGVHWDQERIRDAYGHFYHRFPNGESCADVFDRMSDFMGTLFRDFEKEDFPRNVVIVTHGMAMRCFIMRFFHASVEEFESWANPKNCQYLLLERGDGEKYNLVTPMKLHNVRHDYQFDWSKWTEKFVDLGKSKVPYTNHGT